MKNLAQQKDTREIAPELIGTDLREMMTRIGKKAAGEPQGNNNLPTGFSDLDSITGGLAPGSVNIIAARPSMGRAILALNIASHVALAESLPVVIFSMEMSRMTISTMLACLHASIDPWRTLRNQVIPESKLNQLQIAVAQFKNANIYVDDSPELSAAEIHDRVQRTHAIHNRLGLVVIDSLQLMHLDTGKKNGGYRTTMGSLKILANEFNVPVLVLSELDRKLEKRKNKRPLLADLSTDTIWKNADLVLFIYRDEVYKPDSKDRGSAEIIVGRNRNGCQGVVRLDFESQSVSFVERTEKWVFATR